MQAQSLQVGDVEQWNDQFARENDSNAYYLDSGWIIRRIEQRRLRLIRQMLAPTPGQKVLEVGCGAGHVLQMFRECKLTAVDVSGEMLNKARRNLQGYDTEFHKGQLDELHLPQERFDGIVCTEVLEHTVDPDAVLVDIRRLLHPDGRAVITFPNDHLVHVAKSVIRATGLSLIPPFRRISWGGDKYHLHVWKVGQMRELLARHFNVTCACFAPNRMLPIRCCFLCTSKAQG